MRSLTTELNVRGSAECSADGRYRYLLCREFGGDSTCLFVMLNPSTADGEQDDPTIRRCVGFARREGFGRLEVVNLYGYRATEPKVLIEADDPVGVGNDLAIAGALRRADRVIVAWGNQGGVDAGRIAVIREMVEEAECAVMCFGVTSLGQPRHPRYLSGDAELVEFRGGV